MKPTRSLLSILPVASALVLLSTVACFAQTVDIEQAGSSGTIDGAIFSENDQGAAGTGHIRSFLRVQGHGSEQGYNTDGGFPFNDKNPHNFQHSVLLADLSQFTLNGTAYFKFMLDANQSGGPHGHFTLNQLQFYTSDNGAQTTTTINPDGTLSLGHLAYDLNPGGGTANSVITHSTGSGHFDAVVYVPVSDFNLTDKYVILYMASSNASGGFEEWTAATGGVAPVPEPSSAALFAVSAVGLALGGWLKRRRAA